MKIILSSATLLLTVSACAPRSDVKTSANPQKQPNSVEQSLPVQELEDQNPPAESPTKPPVTSEDASPPTDISRTVTFLSDQVPGGWTKDNWFRRSEMTYEAAQSYCKQLNARIPTAKEFVNQGQIESGRECLVQTAFPGRPANDPAVQEEIKKYGQEGNYHEPIWKIIDGQKSVDFYIDRKPNCGLRGEKTRISGAFWTATQSDGQNWYFGYGHNSGGGVSSGYAMIAGVVCVRDQ